MGLYMVSGNSIGHEHPHGIQYQHAPRTSAWPPVAVQITDMNTTLCQRHHHSPLRQAAQAKDISMISGATWATDTNMDPTGSPAHGHQLDLRLQPKQPTLTWLMWHGFRK